MLKTLKDVELGTEVYYGGCKGTVIAYGTDVWSGNMVLLGYKEPPVQGILSWPITENTPLIWEHILTKSIVPLNELKKQYKFGFWHVGSTTEVDVIESDKKEDFKEHIKLDPPTSGSTINIKADTISLDAEKIFINGREVGSLNFIVYKAPII